MLITGILYKRLQGVVFWQSLYSRALLIGILNKRVQGVVFWNIEIPPRQKLYIPEAYIPERS